MQGHLNLSDFPLICCPSSDYVAPQIKSMCDSTLHLNDPIIKAQDFFHDPRISGVCACYPSPCISGEARLNHFEIFKCAMTFFSLVGFHSSPVPVCTKCYTFFKSQVRCYLFQKTSPQTVTTLGSSAAPAGRIRVGLSLCFARGSIGPCSGAQREERSHRLC